MSTRHFLKMIVLATVCTGVVGFGLKVLIEKGIFAYFLGHDKGEVEGPVFKNLYLIAAGLFLVGVFILVSGWRERKSVAGVIDLRSTIWIGIIQGLCLPFRGFSRSGATISTALSRGIARPLAEDFSFALAVVLTPAVIVHELNRLFHSPNRPGDATLLSLLLPGLVGMVFSFVAGLAALKVLSAVLEKGRWKYFGVYCILFSFVVLTAALCGW